MEKNYFIVLFDCNTQKYGYPPKKSEIFFLSFTIFSYSAMSIPQPHSSATPFFKGESPEAGSAKK